MQPDRPKLIHHRDPSLPAWRRGYEWFLLLSFGSIMVGPFLILIMLWVSVSSGVVSPASGTGSYPTPAMLAVIWGLSLCQLIAWFTAQYRTQASGQPFYPDSYRELRGYGPPGRVQRFLLSFVFAPLFVVFLSASLVTLATPVLLLAINGEVITQPARIEKLGTVRDFSISKRRPKDPDRVRTCYTTIRIIIPTLPPQRDCLRDKRYRSLKSGDGLLYRYVIYGDFYRVTSSYLPAAEMPSDLSADPRLAPYLSRNDP